MYFNLYLSWCIILELSIYISGVKLHFYVVVFFLFQLYNLYNNLVLLLHFPLGYLQMDSIKTIVWYIIDNDSFVDVISISWLCFLLFHQFLFWQKCVQSNQVLSMCLCVWMTGNLLKIMLSSISFIARFEFIQLDEFCFSS